MEQYNDLIGRFFVQTLGYHKGETFECTGISIERGQVFMCGFWACGAYTYEPIDGGLKEITAN